MRHMTQTCATALLQHDPKNVILDEPTNDLEVLAHQGLSTACRHRYPLPLRLLYLTGWGRRHLDMQMIRARLCPP